MAARRLTSRMKAPSVLPLARAASLIACFSSGVARTWISSVRPSSGSFLTSDSLPRGNDLSVDFLTGAGVVLRGKRNTRWLQPPGDTKPPSHPRKEGSQ